MILSSYLTDLAVAGGNAEYAPLRVGGTQFPFAGTAYGTLRLGIDWMSSEDLWWDDSVTRIARFCGADLNWRTGR